jgi:predicted nucleotidyltransferase
MRTTPPTHTKKAAGLAESLFGEYRRRVLAFLLLRPDERFHVREISRLTSVPVGPLHRELKILADAGMVSRHASGNQVQYQADRDCPIYHELAGIFRKTSGLADILRAALEPLFDSVESAFVFGSVAKGEERSASDVDVLVVGSASFTDVVLALADRQTQLGRDINPVVMTEAEFSSKLAAGEHFVSRIMSEPKIFLKGTEHDLGKSQKP